MGKKHFCFFHTAKTGSRTPNSGVKGSGAHHYPRAPAQKTGTEKQRKTQNNTKNPKTTAIVGRVLALTRNSDRKRAEPTVKTQTWADLVKNDTDLATTI